VTEANALLRELGNGPAELASLASLAGRVEMQLLRALRLKLAPGRTAADEADLWFSPIVRTATATGLIFKPETLPELQRRLAAEPDRLDAAWRLLFHLRAGSDYDARERLPTMTWLLLREELTYWSLRGGPASAADNKRVAKLWGWVEHSLEDAKLGADARAWGSAALTALPVAAWELPGAGRLIEAVAKYVRRRPVWLRRVASGAEIGLREMADAHRVEVAAAGAAVRVHVIFEGVDQPGTDIVISGETSAHVETRAETVKIQFPDRQVFSIAISRPTQSREADVRSSVRRYSVMISSTHTELRPHREAIIAAVRSQLMLPLNMEFESAVTDKNVIDASLARVDEADAYLGLISYRYGQTPVDSLRNPQELSLTELEYRRAVERRLPRCMFIMHDDHLVSRGEMHRESGALVAKLNAFIARVKQDRVIYSEFRSVDDLEVKAMQSLAQLREELDAGPERERLPLQRPQYEIDRIAAYTPGALIGREAETAFIAEAWEKAAKGLAHPHVLTFVAFGGEGKTALIASFANELAARGWRDCEAAFAWSFYRQGSVELAGASSDLFFAAALAFFGLEAKLGESSYDTGKRLAGVVGAKRALLILDGVEPLQYPASSPQRGELKDDGLRALLRTLSARNAGLCLVTSRFRIADLSGKSALQRELAGLGEEAGARLLTALGVRGPEAEKRRLVVDVRGHPLTLEIIGGYLRDAWGGDIAKRDLVKFEAADEEKAMGHAFRAMQAYADWLASAGAAGARALSLLRLTGLFDRPADAGCIGALLRAPPIAGLTEALFTSETKLPGLKRSYLPLSPEEVNTTLARLHDAKLLTVTRGAGGALLEIDAHPLLREYFAAALRQMPDVAREGHGRIYEHLTTTAIDQREPTLDDLAPLYQAVAHGCAAGLWQQTFDEVYLNRICRGSEDYAVRKLGALGADLGAVACFFETPWRRVSPHLNPASQTRLLSLAGLRLRALGRLAEAREPMRAFLEMSVAQQNWHSAAIAASNLSGLELTLGDCAAAVALGRASVDYADRIAKGFELIFNLTMLAEALHQAGERDEAQALFAASELMQARQQPQHQRLASVAGFQYCDLLLGASERAVWRRLVAAAGAGAAPLEPLLAQACAEVGARAAQSLDQASRERWLLVIGLDHLTLARAALFGAVVRDEPPPGEHVATAVAFIRRSGAQDHLPRALLTRALYRAVCGDFAGACEDLDEAYEIAERGPMRLHLADVYLYRARLFGLLANRPSQYPWSSADNDLAQARRVIEVCGYGRRLEELQNAEAALR